MPHQINLLDASLLRKREAFDSATGLGAMVASAVIAFGLTAWLESSTRDASGAAAAAEVQLSAMAIVGGGPLPAASRDAAELARLRSIEAGQRRVLAALDSGQAGA
ncbi:MAG: hypothetical protein ABIV63_11815, partial [Caldimonas sp.]